MIPKQLQHPEIKFVLLEKGGKKPIQKDWQNKHIKYNDRELLEHVSSKGNYGVMGGGGKQLIIIDFDNESVQNILVPQLPKTFTVKTGSGKLHKYFFSDGTQSFKIFDEEMNTIADVQGEGKQVVGAGSIHPNGNAYEIVDESEIAFLPYAEIKALICPYDKRPKKEPNKSIERPREMDVQDDFISDLKSSLAMSEVLSSFGVDTTKNPTGCPFHASKGGKCLGFNRETAHCFHCDGSWNIFSFVKAIKNISSKEAIEYLANLAGMENELELSRRKYKERLHQERHQKEQEILFQYLALIKEKKWGDASELLVSWLLQNNSFYTTKVDDKSEVWVYKEGVYVPQGKSEIKEQLRALLGNWYSTFIYNQVMAKIEPDTFIDLDVLFSGGRVEEIPVQNGILNIFTRELQPFTPEKIFFNKLNVTYDSRAKCPRIDQFLSEVLSKEEDSLVFHELGGFCLLKEYRYEKAFLFLGNGRNGKDKSLELIKRLIGIANCCSVPLASIIPDSFIISEFHNKMVNLSGEINNQDLKDTSAFKGLTGRSLQSAPRKFLNPVHFVNHAKFVFACNELPMVYDNSLGFWDRWVVLDFPYTFVTQEEIDKAEKKDFLKLRDDNIIDKITTPEELSGLLNKFLDGLDRLLKNKRFSSTKGSEEVKQDWIRKSNSCMAFCISEIDDAYDSYIPKHDFRKRYAAYCKKHKVIPRSDKVILRTLEELYGVSTEHKDLLGQRVWAYAGVKWKGK